MVSNASLRLFARFLARAEVDAARQFANDDQVHALQHLGLERAGADQLRVQLDRTHVGEEVQLLAQRQQPALRAVGRVGVVPFRAAHCAEQDGVRRLAGRNCFVRQTVAHFVDGAAAHHLRIKGERVRKFLRDDVQDLLRFGGYFRTDAVAGQHYDGCIPCYSLSVYRIHVESIADSDRYWLRRRFPFKEPCLADGARRDLSGQYETLGHIMRQIVALRQLAQFRIQLGQLVEIRLCARQGSAMQPETRSPTFCRLRH